MAEPNWLEREYMDMEAELIQAIDQIQAHLDQARAEGRTLDVIAGESTLALFKRHYEETVNRFAPEISLN